MRFDRLTAFLYKRFKELGCLDDDMKEALSELNGQIWKHWAIKKLDSGLLINPEYQKETED